MRAEAVIAAACLPWVLWATPVHGLTSLALAPTATAAAEASHCSGSHEAGRAEPAPTPDAERGSAACLLHCTTLAQAAVSAVPAAPLPGPGLVGLVAAQTAVCVGPQARAGIRTPHRGPPAPDLLGRNAILRL